MSWFGNTTSGYEFEAFRGGHVYALLVLAAGAVFLYARRGQLQQRELRRLEWAVAFSLLLTEITAHLWRLRGGFWSAAGSLPLDLCSISLILTIILLMTRSRTVYELVFFTGIGGAMQAMLTPYLFYDFPHFRYFHFFYIHIAIILVALYFTWVHGFRPTFISVLKTMLFLNILLPIVWFINMQVNGNYMFLREKPSTGSLLDVLGPYPYYILSMELITFGTFVLLWLLFRDRKKRSL